MPRLEPEIGRVELSNQELPFHLGSRGELVLDVDVEKGSRIVVYYYVEDDCHSYDVLSVEATKAGAQIRWNSRESRELGANEKQALKPYLQRRVR